MKLMQLENESFDYSTCDSVSYNEQYNALLSVADHYLENGKIKNISPQIEYTLQELLHDKSMWMDGPRSHGRIFLLGLLVGFEHGIDYCNKKEANDE